MTCQQVDTVMDRQIGEGVLTLTPEAASHLSRCPRCRSLYGPPGSVPSTTEVEAKVLGRIRADLRPVRPLPPAKVFLGSFLLVFLAVLIIGGVLFHTEALSRLTTAQIVAVTGLILAGAFVTAQSLATQMYPGARHWFRPYLLVLGIPASLVLAAAILFPWSRPWVGLVSGSGCATAGLLVSLPFALIVSWIAARGVTLSSSMVGATAGLFAGLAGSLLLTYHCAITEATHVMVWHVLGIPGVSALLGWLLGRVAGSTRQDSARA